MFDNTPSIPLVEADDWQLIPDDWDDWTGEDVWMYAMPELGPFDADLLVDDAPNSDEPTPLNFDE